MRLGVLGPANGDLPGLARAAQRLLDEHKVERVLYVGSDDALDRVVAGWARQIVGLDPSEHALFDRAARRCAAASADDVEKFVDAERARARLRVFTSLPPAPKRTIELLGTPPEHKRHVALDGGHVPTDMRGMIREVLDWFDTYLGPVGHQQS